MNFKSFDITSFLKASKKWEDDLERLERELANMSELPSINNKTGVRSGSPSDMTAQMALRRLQIAAEIEEIKLCQEQLIYAKKILTEDERELIDGFFFPKKKIGVFVQEYGQRHGLCKDYVYRDKNKTLKKMAEAIDKKYYEGE